MAGRQTIPGAKAPVPKKKSAKAKAEAKEAKKAKKPSTPKGTGKKLTYYVFVFFTLKVQLTIPTMAIRVVEFQMGDTKLERFLSRNKHTQRKLLSFEFWINGELSKIGCHYSNKVI